jgi:indoleamine 2,3-dioxygenase
MFSSQYDKSSFFNSIFIPDEKHGFLPLNHPLKSLPDYSDLCIQLNRLAKNLPLLIKTKKIRNEVDRLNKQYHDELLHLKTKQEMNIAILILTMLCQAYIWENFKDPKNTIPSVISKNLNKICQSLQRFHILTYSDYVLNNWQLKDLKNGFQVDNIEPLFTFTGTTDEAWFIKIHIAIEAAAASALRAAYEACQLSFRMNSEPIVLNEELEAKRITHLEKIQLSINSGPVVLHEELEVDLITHLEKIKLSINNATTLLLRMKEHCHYDTFYNTIRLFLSGWDDKLAITFEGSHSQYKYKGPSGAQSSIFPALDEALGVKHEINGMHQELLTFKHYMPHEHLHFIHVLKLRNIQLPSNSSEKLMIALNDAVNSIQTFRYMHRFAMVGRYIVKPAAKQGVSSEDIVGTGGTKIDDYLEGRRVTTQVMRSRL